MTQNVSTAVMQRRVEPHDSLDDFPTPPWATRALCEWLQRELDQDLADRSCREPAANRGHMVRPLREYFASVEASDVHDYGAGFPVEDYLFGPNPDVDWTITNPPFRLAEQFIEKASMTSRHGFAFLVRAAFLESVGRYEGIFSRNPPSYVLQFTERVVMHKGKLSANGSTATAYAWLVWVEGEDDTRLRWIAPCRKQLERAEDYQQMVEPRADPLLKGERG
ncbi:methyltransferase [Sphingobium fuliginis]|uniref:Methyltransferase n=1 Tax=Sphingobium fuliginis ATCC 27551 TaxID=1208342 RepID=A0A5B8CGK7_SPHSA|nr:methyltransferase [Sphingobium fuliginis]QDC37120.1 methyltransferase [Sphingobium fuliginis ATCC 27551]